MTKILVNGGAGFIGSHIVDLFVSHGYELVIGPAKVGEPRHTYLNADKTKRDLSWALTISPEDDLHKSVECFKTSENAI